MMHIPNSYNLFNDAFVVFRSHKDVTDNSQTDKVEMQPASIYEHDYQYENYAMPVEQSDTTYETPGEDTTDVNHYEALCSGMPTV